MELKNTTKINPFLPDKRFRRINTGQLPRFEDMTSRMIRSRMRRMSVAQLYELRETAVRNFRSAQGKNVNARQVISYAEKLIALRVGAETVL